MVKVYTITGELLGYYNTPICASISYYNKYYRNNPTYFSKQYTFICNKTNRIYTWLNDKIWNEDTEDVTIIVSDILNKIIVKDDKNSLEYCIYKTYDSKVSDEYSRVWGMICDDFGLTNYKTSFNVTIKEANTNISNLFVCRFENIGSKYIHTKGIDMFFSSISHLNIKEGSTISLVINAVQKNDDGL